MSNIFRIRTSLTGFTGGPGVCTMYTADMTDILNNLHAMWNTIAAYMPTDVTIQVENSGDRIEATTGALVDGWTDTAVASITGGSGGSYAAPAGMGIDWITSTVLDGKRVRGRTFIVPLAGASFQDDGTIATAALSEVSGAAAGFALAEAGNFVVWHRPRAARAAGGGLPALTAHEGGVAVVTGFRVPDKVFVLRSRRD